MVWHLCHFTLASIILSIGGSFFIEIDILKSHAFSTTTSIQPACCSLRRCNIAFFESCRRLSFMGFDGDYTNKETVIKNVCWRIKYVSKYVSFIQCRSTASTCISGCKQCYMYLQNGKLVEVVLNYLFIFINFRWLYCMLIITYIWRNYNEKDADKGMRMQLLMYLKFYHCYFTV